MFNETHMKSKEFDLGDVLSLTTGDTVHNARMLSPQGMVGVRTLVSHITGENMITDSAVILLAQQCRDALLAQHPDLQKVDETTLNNKNVEKWLTDQRNFFGARLTVNSLV